MRGVIHMKKQNANATAVGITAEDFLANGNGKKGKPARPGKKSNGEYDQKVMTDGEWYRVLVSIRIPKLLNAIESVSRLPLQVGFNAKPKGNARMLKDIKAKTESMISIIESALNNPTAKVKVAKKRDRYMI